MNHNENILQSLNELVGLNLDLAKTAREAGNVAAAAKATRAASDAAEQIYRLQRQEKQLQAETAADALASAVVLIKQLNRALDSQSGAGIECARWLAEHGY